MKASWRAAGTALFCALTSLIAPPQAHAALYSFTSHTFTNCTATGFSGPTLANCTTAYSTTWDGNINYFTVVSGIQEWVVPASGTYSINAVGAGGSGSSYVGGNGASMTGTFSLTEGSRLRILVGQTGLTTTRFGGGGGSFVTTSSNTALIVGGGGGGSGLSAAGGNASTNASPSNSNGALTAPNGTGGCGESGAGGAGFTGNGNGSPASQSFTNGGAGGGGHAAQCKSQIGGEARGGFGGGGAGANGGGGGGGYYGGEGGPNTNPYAGGSGGGSYNSGTNQSNSLASNSNTAGSVTITFLAAPDSTPPIITGPNSSTGSTSSISIQENSTSVFTFAANESSTWTVSGADASFFSIAASGALTISSRNFETPADQNGDNAYIVVVTATDLMTNASTQTLTVTITGVNEPPTITTNSSAATYAFTHIENSNSATTFQCTDVDSGTSLTWSISGIDSLDFTLGSQNGQLQFSSSPDFEAPRDADTNNTYIFVLSCSDGTLSDTQTVTVTVTDIVEGALINTPSISGAAYKGTQVTITVISNVTGKIRFFVNGKRIATCKDQLASGTYPNNTATCAWKPSVMGNQIITATISPNSNGFTTSTSSPLQVWVAKRSTRR